MKKTNFKILLLSLVLFLFTACNNSSSSSSNEQKTDNTKNNTISGYMQKGPFKKASLVKAYKLQNGEKTNDVIEVQILNDKGEYSLSVPWSGATLLEVSGDYLDEVSGNYVQNQQLSSVTQVKENIEIKSNINILTHIASKNILENLKNNPNEKIDDVINSAHTLVANTFNIDLEENTSLDDLDLTDSKNENTKKANAQLLKVSASILSTSNPNDVIEKISEDLKDDGNIDDEGMSAFDEVKQKEKNIDLDDISKNLEEKLNIVDIPDNLALDGTLNLDNNISFSKKTDMELDSFIESDEVTISGANGNLRISIENGEFKIDDNNYTSTPTTITNDQKLKIKHKTSTKYNTKTKTKILIAGTPFIFESNTKADPNKFTVSDASYSNKNKTKDNVNVSFTINGDVQTPSGWTKSGNNFTKEYSSNVNNEEVVFSNLAGFTIKKIVNISNIDKTAPNVSDASYSNESTTKNPVIVTFICDDSDVQTPSGWTKSGNKFTKSFTSNTNETIIFTDDVGNETNKSIIITNIDNFTPAVISFNGIDYKEVQSPKTKKVWLNKNLGANEVCNGSNDSLCVGDYFQWGRKANGHEKKDSNTSNEQLNSDVVSDGKFITPESSPYHWEDSQKTADLWSGVNAVNNVCPNGYKVPSKYELEAEFIKDSTINPKDSFLKIPASSYRNNDGEMYTSSTDTYLWSSSSDSSIISFDGIALKFDDRIRFEDKRTSLGIPVRCIKNYEDSTAPNIIKVKIGEKELKNNDTNVSVTDDITIEFSEELRSENISSGTISLTRSGSSALYPKYANKIVTFSKGSDDELLDRGYEYTLRITTDIKDIIGNNIASEYVLKFETIPAPDTTLPKIDFANSSLDSSSSNSKNSNVSVSNNLKIVFNESIDANTINTSNVLLDNSADYKVSLENNKELIISFDSNLSYETTYNLVLKEDIQDLAGNKLNPSTYGNSSGDKTITFSTEDAPDVISPEVQSSNPSSGDSDVGISSNIIVTFSEQIKDYNASTVVLKKDSDDSIIATALSYNNKILTINPDNTLEESTYYKLILSTGIKDSSDNALANEVEIAFTTGTASSCSGTKIDNICYEVSTTKKTWEEAKNICEGENKSLVQKDSISDWVDMASSSKLDLNENEDYWLFEGEAGTYKQSTYLRYNQYSSPKWGTTTTYNDSQKLFICKKDSLSPSASLTKPTNTSDVSTKATFKITFNEDVKDVNSSNVLLKDNTDSIIASSVSYDSKVLTIKPSNDLSTSTNYKIILKDGITDLYANKLVEKIISFTTSSVAATCSGTEIDNICYELSEDTASRDNAKSSCESSNKVLLSKNSSVNWASLAADLELNTANKYWLDGEYSSSSGYVLYFSGSWKVYTYGESKSNTYKYICVSDKIAPVISSSTPANNASDVSTKANIKITFDEAIKESTLTSANIELKKNAEDTLLDTTITYSNKVVTINASNDFDISSTYNLKLKAGITDLFANNLSETNISFTTSSLAATCEGTEINAKCYVLVTDKKSWSDAATYCSNNSGMILSKENADLQNIAQGLNLNTSTNYWIKEDHGSTYGMSLVYSGGTWQGDGYGPSKSKSTKQEFICKKD